MQLFLRRTHGLQRVGAAAAILALALTPLAGFPTRAQPPNPELNRWSALLRLMPATEALSEVALYDYDVLRQALGLMRPALDAPPDEVERYRQHILDATDRDRWIRLSGIGGTTEEWQRRFGFTHLQVSQEIVAATVNVDNETIPMIIRGQFDPAAMDAALQAEGFGADRLDDGSHRGQSYYRWGEEGLRVDLRRRAALRDVGQARRVVASTEHIFLTRSAPFLHGMIDCQQGGGACLGDDENLELLGRALTQLGTYRATFVAGPLGLAHRPFWGEVYPGTPLLEPHLGFAAGTGLSAQGPYLAIAVLHSDAGTAVRNAELFHERVRGTEFDGPGDSWSHVVESIDVRVEDRLLLARLSGSQVASAWLDLRVSSLLQHQLSDVAPAAPRAAVPFR